MTKKIKIIITISCIVLALAIALGVFIVQKRNEEFQQAFANDTLPDGNGRKANIVVLAGQSNAAGCSGVSYLQQEVSPEKFSQYQNGYDNVYINYVTGSGTVKSNGFVKCKAGQGENAEMFGPELGLAEEFNRNYPDDLFFIVKWAWSGTSLSKDWLSPTSEGATGRLYYPFVRFIQDNVKYLYSKNYDVAVTGICWMQGESDALDFTSAIMYYANLTQFVDDLRDDIKDYGVPSFLNDSIIFVDAQICDKPDLWTYCDNVNQGKDYVEFHSAHNFLIKTNDYYDELVCNKEPYGNPDLAHYDAESELLLGKFFAYYFKGYLYTQYVGSERPTYQS